MKTFIVSIWCFSNFVNWLVSFTIFCYNELRKVVRYRLCELYFCVWAFIHFPNYTFVFGHRTDKYSEHSSIIWPVYPNGWVFVYEVNGFVFKSSCSHLSISVAVFSVILVESVIFSVELWLKSCSKNRYVPLFL